MLGRSSNRNLRTSFTTNSPILGSPLVDDESAAANIAVLFLIRRAALEKLIREADMELVAVKEKGLLLIEIPTKPRAAASADEASSVPVPVSVGRGWWWSSAHTTTKLLKDPTGCLNHIMRFELAKPLPWFGSAAIDLIVSDLFSARGSPRKKV